MILGVDVSHNNGPIDWPSVGRSDVKFAYAKATEGRGHEDPAFERNWSEMAKAKLYRGAYHFARPGTAARPQADFFAAMVGELGPGDLPPALDLEAQDGQDAAQLLDWTLAFVARIDALLGRKCVIYTGRLWRETMGNPMAVTLAEHPLWTARYGSQPPVVPATWHKWDIWQFTNGINGDARIIPGIRGSVDCDWFNGDAKALAELAGVAPMAA